MTLHQVLEPIQRRADSLIDDVSTPTPAMSDLV